MALDVVMVSVEEPPVVTDVGLNVAVAPLGRPAADRATVCEAPVTIAVDTVEVTGQRRRDTVPAGERDKVRGEPEA